MLNDPAGGASRGSATATRVLKTESDIAAWIINETRKHPASRVVELCFVLVGRPSATEDEPSWEVREVAGWTRWPMECRKVFLDSVVRAQTRFDLL